MKWFARYLRCRRGALAMEFALVLPLLLTVTLGTLELGVIVFNYHTASEATRRAARQAAIQDPIPDLEDLSSADIVCTSSGGSVSCGGTTVDSADSFTAIVTSAQATTSWVDSDNITVTYSDSGVVADAAGNIVTPLVTVRITGVRYEFITLGLIPGMPTGFDYPAFTAARMTPSKLIDD